MATKKLTSREPEFAWDRAAKEPSRAWETFQVYRDMKYHQPAGKKNGGRSLIEISKRFKISTTAVERYSAKWKWIDRTRAYDNWIDKNFLQKETVSVALELKSDQLIAERSLRAVGMKMLAEVSKAIDDKKIDAKQMASMTERLLSAAVRIEQIVLTGMDPKQSSDTTNNIQVNHNGGLEEQTVIIIPDNGRQ